MINNLLISQSLTGKEIRTYFHNKHMDIDSKEQWVLNNEII